MRTQTRLYNVIFPLWMLLFFPAVWLIVLPANLLIDGLVVLLTLIHLKHSQKAAVLGRVWWKVWLMGFSADFVGAGWMLLGLVPCWIWPNTPFGRFWEDTVGHAMHNPFAAPGALLWTVLAVVLAAVCIYFFDRRALRSCPLLTPVQQHKLALSLAVFTAPWFFFWPVY